MRYLAIKSYWRHQHYHKRGAPWIKLHASVLTDAAFIQLPEVAQAQLMKLWSLASQLGHPLPNNPKLLAGKIGTTGKFHLAAIIAAGFIVPCDSEEEAGRVAKQRSDDKNASISLGESVQPSREIEEELEKDPSPATAQDAEAEAGLAALLVTDADRIALTAVVTRARSRYACLVAFRSMLLGEDTATPRPSPEVFGQALRDMAMNDERPTANLFRGYLRRAADALTRRDAPPSGAGAHAVLGARRGNPPDTGRATVMLGRIREMVRESRQPGQGTFRFIPKSDVAALGDDVLAAYESVGGAERFIAAEGEKVSFLIKEFAFALDAQGAAHV